MGARKDRETSLYLIQSLDNGGVYVGITSRLSARWSAHRKAGTKAHPLYNSIRKYGVERHTFSVLETFSSRAEASEAEQWWIAYLRGLGARVFNLTAGGDTGCTGYRQSAETKEKRAAKLRGRKFGEAQRRNMAAAQQRRFQDPNEGAKVSAALHAWWAACPPDEAFALRSANRKGQRMSSEVRAILAERKRGRKLSDAHRARIAEGLRQQAPEAIERRAAANRGQKRSEETKRRIGAANSGLTDEKRAQLLSLHGQGLHLKAIAREMEHPHITIRRWMDRLGVASHEFRRAA